jgi:hypothetical protein
VSTLTRQGWSRWRDCSCHVHTFICILF